MLKGNKIKLIFGTPVFEVNMINSLSLFFSILLLLLPACSSHDQQMPDTSNSKLKTSAESFIKNKTGSDYFNLYFKYSNITQNKIDNTYNVSFIFSVGGSELQKKTITINVDSTGKIKSDIVEGIPDCFNDILKCQYSIDEKQARKIASDAGFEKGIKEWKIEFSWEEKYKNYVWKITSVKSETQSTNGTRVSGLFMYIDAVDGKIIETSPWFVR